MADWPLGNSWGSMLASGSWDYQSVTACSFIVCSDQFVKIQKGVVLISIAGNRGVLL
ncbi:conserved hypothetical protein [Ricinus communis]|uniref:Uncharacterized protein n=1 Tax=Ricinus communis TaxID=3988 RepID=B9SYL3_RICCO|nr:conserved hypothetical protein [Ricinus communis]